MIDAKSAGHERGLLGSDDPIAGHLLNVVQLIPEQDDCRPAGQQPLGLLQQLEPALDSPKAFEDGTFDVGQVEHDEEAVDVLVVVPDDLPVQLLPRRVPDVELAGLAV